MKYIYFILISFLLLASCNTGTIGNSTKVSNISELNNAFAEAEPGDEIVMTAGIWTDAKIHFYGEGTEKKPITLRAEEPGKTIIEGQSYLHLGGEYLVVEGLYFKNGYSPSSSVIRYQIGKDSTAFHCRVTQCVVEDFNKPSRLTNDRWISFFGRHNTMDYCYIAGKSNDGETLRVFQGGNKHQFNHHQITNNYFGPRPRKGGPRGETIRVGDSSSSMTPGYVNISNNYFDRCNGEVEVISDKTNFNTFGNNIFYKCEGSLVMRHSDFTSVDGNMFIGGDESDFYGGIRVINSGHWITNNYFYKINGYEFRSPLALMNGIPKSPLNRYKQVTDVVVAYNTWIDCKSPFQVGVGQNMASVDVLPKSEIRSAQPIRTLVANNIIYNEKPDDSPVVNHHRIDGVEFVNNLIDNGGEDFTSIGSLDNQEIKMTAVNDWLMAPTGMERLDSTYQGFEFERIENDVFDNSRKSNNKSGAIADLSAAKSFKLETDKYGPTWFNPNPEKEKANIHTASTYKEIINKISEAKDGDILILTAEEININESIKIDKALTIRPEKNTTIINYTGGANTPAFELNPGGELDLKNVSLVGNNSQLSFAPLKENMSSAYKLNLTNCEISNFATILEATPGSFADSINISNTTFSNCTNGFVLAAEKKGDYNAEMFTIKNSTFNNISQNVIHFFRGGYDESTIGGFLRMNNNTFTNCGAKERSGVLIKTRGIINVHMNDNTFTNNRVKNIAILWGAKNNLHAGNKTTNSGTIKVEEQQKLELLY